MSVQQVDPSFAAVEERYSKAPATPRQWTGVGAWGVVGAAAALALGPLLVEYGRQLWSAEHYQFFPMLLAAAGWLAWRRFPPLPTLISQPCSPSLRVAAWSAALLATAVALFARSPFVAAIAVLVLMLAALYEWGGSAALRHFSPVWAVLLLALRLPFNWDQRLIVAMQRAATSWASGTLDLLGIRHLADGVVIRLPEGDFFVDEACSGVHSLFATAAFVAVFAVAARRGVFRFAVLLAAAIFWVLVANAVRILAVVVLSTRYGLPVVDGFGHELLGVVIFAAVIGLVLSTDRLLLFVLPPKEKFPGEATAPVTHERSEPAKRRGLLLPIGVATGLIGIVGGMKMLPANTSPIDANTFANAQGLAPVPEDALPKAWNGWTKIEFQIRERAADDPAGEISRIWYYRKGRLVAAVSIDGPFDAWHDTEVCYDGLGYSTQSREDHPAPGGGASSGGYTELAITGGAGRHGHVLFMAYSEAGDALSPPPSRNASFARLVSIWKERFSGEAPLHRVDGPIYQVQVFSESGLAFTLAEQEELRRLFHGMRKEIAHVTADKTRATDSGVVQQDAGELET